jgi:hypothetical protein
MSAPFTANIVHSLDTASTAGLVQVFGPQLTGGLVRAFGPAFTSHIVTNMRGAFTGEWLGGWLTARDGELEWRLSRVSDRRTL